MNEQYTANMLDEPQTYRGVTLSPLDGYLSTSVSPYDRLRYNDKYTVAQGSIEPVLTQEVIQQIIAQLNDNRNSTTTTQPAVKPRANVVDVSINNERLIEA